MELKKQILTNNACYKANQKIKVKGIMVHSTGANNPWLKRYVGPDDGYLGVNTYGNHWNTYTPGGRQICCHAFIGKLKDGSIATYQTLPWDHRGWHAGGAANNTHIGFEICEDGLTDKTNFNKVYKEAVELCVYLCKLYGLTADNIICHSEGYKKGIATNHGDVMHWFPKHGKSMDTFRAEVKKALDGASKTETTTKLTTSTTTTTTTTRKTTSFKENDKVEFKTSATKYNPSSSTIPDWVKEDYYHVVTQTKSNGKAVKKGGKTCVLLGEKVNKKTGKTEDGINTWVAIENLTLVGKTTTTTTTTPAYTTYTVKENDTLWDIAKAKLGSGLRYTEIVKLNNLKNDTIYEGQKLKIPN